MAGHSRTLSITLPQPPARPWGLTPLSETGVTATVPGELKGTSTCLRSRSSHGDHLIKSHWWLAWCWAAPSGNFRTSPLCHGLAFEKPCGDGGSGKPAGVCSGFFNPSFGAFQKSRTAAEEGCRNDGEGAGNDGLGLWSPYPKLGLTGTSPSTLWQRLEWPDSRPQQDSLHNLATAPPLGHVASHPHPLIRNRGYGNGTG